MHLPTMSSSPKAELHALYGMPPRRKIISEDNYITWHDDGPPHLLHFSSVFICPCTGEVFASGRYGDPTTYRVVSHRGSLPGEEFTVVWYKKKKMAEHGAASRAFDCLMHRRNYLQTGITVTIKLGDETPYLLEQAQPLPPRMPDKEKEKAEVQMRLCRTAIRQENSETTVEGSFSQTEQQRSQNPQASSKVIRLLTLIEVSPEDLIDETNRSCPVCLEPILLKSHCIRLPCAHIFHNSCIKQWLNSSCKCPTCRFELPTSDLEYERGRSEWREDEGKDNNVEREQHSLEGFRDIDILDGFARAHVHETSSVDECAAELESSIQNVHGGQFDDCHDDDAPLQLS